MPPLMGSSASIEPGKRVIDGLINDGKKRTRPMQVLCIGHGRTGSASLHAALKILGYKSYHLVESIKNPTRDFGMWEECMRAKFLGEGPRWGLLEWDAALGDFEATIDAPSNFCWEDLIELYPDAKVIMTTRDPDKWLASVQTSIGLVLKWNWWVAKFDGTLAGPWWSFCYSMLPIITGEPEGIEIGLPAKRAFIERNEKIQRTVPKERLLVHLATDGWTKLCPFLGKDVPAQPYPRVNESEGFVAIHRMIWWMGFGKMVLKTVVPALMVGGAAFYFQGHKMGLMREL